MRYGKSRPVDSTAAGRGVYVRARQSTQGCWLALRASR